MVSLTLATLTLLLHTLSVAAVPNDLALRQESHSITEASSTSASSTSSADTAVLTGTFVVNGAPYDVTSLSGYAIVAGHTLTPGGPGALVGGVEVTEASGGFVANGLTVPLATYTSVSTSTSSSSASATTTVPGPAGQSPVASTISTSGLAVATGVPMAGAAVLGGMMGLMLL